MAISASFAYAILSMPKFRIEKVSKQMNDSLHLPKELDDDSTDAKLVTIDSKEHDNAHMCG